MAVIIKMPRLSDTMEEGTVATWLKKINDKVEEGDILAEIETDKATMEFESFHEGTLLHIGIKEGESAKVDELLAVIGEEGEDISSLISNSQKKEQEIPVEAEKSPVNSGSNNTSIEDLPEDVTIVTMPRLSDTMEEGTVATWLKKIGDTVEEGDILAEIETDKATMEFESFQSGTLLYIGLSEGESAKVDALLAIIGPAGTDVSSIATNFKAGETTQEKKQEIATSSKIEESTSSASISSSTSNSNGRIFASPLAKKIAKDKGIDLSNVKGTGDSGRVIKRDIENYKPTETPIKASASPEGSKIITPKFVPAGKESFDEVSNSNMRKAIAKNLAKSKFSAPHYYLNVEFDMEETIAFRKQINDLPDVKISFNDIIVKACAMALKKHPQLNSQWSDESMRLNHHVHIGIAVAVPDGLVVPVLKFADEQSLTQINAAVKNFASKARDKKLSLDEMEGSTFTISNLGMFGIESFTSIINQPNSAILSVGAIIEKPVIKNKEIVIGNTMKLTMACDHRTVDGVTGSKFLQTLQQYIEKPVTMFI